MAQTVKIHLLNHAITNYVDELLLSNQHTGNKTYTLTDEYNEADFILLPYSWEHYYKEKGTEELKQIIVKSMDSGKKLIGITNGDFGYRPLDTDTILFKRGGKKSKSLKNQFEIPRFFGDPVADYYSGIQSFREKKEQITLGFCGKVNDSLLHELKDTASSCIIHLQYFVNKKSKVPMTIYPSSNRLRKTVLDNCRRPNITANFLLRKKFMNGLLGQSQDVISQHKSTLEFYDNIRNSDYTVCMRGVGNYSIRFYQTLASGRIPLFINTDCMLPFEQDINWKAIIPWVEYRHIKQLPKLLFDFHNSLSAEEFIERQKLMRKIWEDYMSTEGFLSQIWAYINKRHIP